LALLESDVIGGGPVVKSRCGGGTCSIRAHSGQKCFSCGVWLLCVTVLGEPSLLALDICHTAYAIVLQKLTFAASRVNGEAAAVLNGTLEVNLINGFLPSLGDTFSIMTFTSSSGRFSAVTGNHLANGLVLVPRYSATNVALVAAKELQPSALTLGSNRFSFSFSSESGFSYVVEYTDALGPAALWQTLTNLSGTGSILSAVDPSANVPKRFYRVRFQ